MTTNQGTPHRIVAAMNEAERSQKWTAEKSGLAISTFRRKINGGADFTIGEVARVAAALSVKPLALLPDEFCNEAAK